MAVLGISDISNTGKADLGQLLSNPISRDLEALGPRRLPARDRLKPAAMKPVSPSACRAPSAGTR